MSNNFAISSNNINNNNYNVNVYNNANAANKNNQLKQAEQKTITESSQPTQNNNSNNITNSVNAKSGNTFISANKLPELILQLLPPIQSVENVETNKNIIINNSSPNVENSNNTNNISTPFELGKNVNTQS